MTVTDGGRRSASDSATVTVLGTARAPTLKVAVVGGAKVSTVKNVVIRAAATSASGAPVAYQWAAVEGPPLNLADPDVRGKLHPTSIPFSA